MASAAWGPGSFMGPTVGAYEQAGNWLPAIVPDETAHFGVSFVNTVTLSSPVAVGTWSITGSYVFIASSTLSFTAAGIVGPAVIVNSGTVNFLNSSSAGNATIVVGKTGTLNFQGGSTGGNATLAVDAENSQFGRVNFHGDGPAHDHKLTVGSIQGGGIFDLGSNEVTVGINNASTTVSGPIVGAGRLVKDGYGTMTLNGANSFSGGTFVNEGHLIVNGVIGKVTVGENLYSGYGVLGGNGTVGATTVGYGWISPGLSSTPGRLTTGTLRLTDLSNLGIEIIDGTFPGPGGYDQINVLGKVKLGRSNLQTESLYDYNPVRHKLTIIVNDKKDKVDGTFGGGLHGTLREGDAFVVTEQVYSISYKGGTGNDVVLRSEGPNIVGTNNADVIGLDTSPTHTATKRADYVNALDGNDSIFTGRGNDTVLGGDGADFMDGGAGQDFVSFMWESGDVTATLKGGKLTTVKLDGVAHDQFRNFEHLGGGDGNDRLTGDRKDNVLRGSDGNDTLKGGGGDDMLFGHSDHDLLKGGGGRDKFVFTRYGEHDFDRVADFRRGEDKLVLDGYQFYELGAKLNKSEFYAKKGATQAHDSSDHLIYDPRTGTLYYDRDGLGGYSADIIATLKGRPTLSASDFEII